MSVPPTCGARLLANGRYAVLVGPSGAGYSRRGETLLTAWTPDRTEEPGGFFFYLRDLDSGEVWSSSQQPTRAAAEIYATPWRAGCAIIDSTRAGIAARSEICVGADDDIEIRRLRLHNATARRRRIEVTTYLEVVLFPAAAHAAHPAFAKLFVETELDAESGALLARRRPRAAGESHPWLLHALLGGAAEEHETDRGRFLGRGRTPAAPAALASAAPLSGTTGSVLDPILSLRRSLSLDPGASGEVAAVLACGQARAEVLAALARADSGAGIDAVLAGAAAREEAIHRRLGLTPERSSLLQHLAAAVVYGEGCLRADEEILRRASGNPGDLDRWGLTGTAPLIVVEAAAASDPSAMDELRRARAYWRDAGLETRLAVIAESGCPPEVGAAVDAGEIAIGGLAAGEADLLRACAALHIGGEAGGGDLLARLAARLDAAAPPPAASAEHQTNAAATAALEHGFSPDGSEYQVRVDPARGAVPPMPWVNVLANETFGTLVSESGAAHTWSGNSREHRLTPWSNDPVSDPCGEALYLRDDDSGEFWSPLPAPCPAGSYAVAHGFGHSRWAHTSHAIEQEVRVFVARTGAVRVTRVRLTNRADHSRRLSLYSYARLVLGGLAEESARFVVTWHDAESGAVLARNAMNAELSAGVVFAAAGSPRGGHREHTCDRGSFLGRPGAVARPVAVAGGAALDGRSGAGLDPCAALRLHLELAPGESAECTVLLGHAGDAAEARALVARYGAPAQAESAFNEVRDFWRAVSAAVEVRTPSAAIDRLLNSWLAYQTLACRLWARTAFYQSGGAFGFRDQLQDSMAFALTRPGITRAQILLHAAHQFVEGDVLHWWHPPASRGIRTRFADDLVWLPWITAGYVAATGDWSVLEERAPFITARALEPGEDEAYLQPRAAAESADVYEHCCRALDRALTRGRHGLPLFGTGDWNDGMNRVGREGRGESVWMAFFLHRVLADFLPLCRRRGDGGRAERYLSYRRELEAALEGAAWDGAWYRRGYYDDGTTLGAAADAECRIDTLAQAWSVLSGAVPRARAERAMESAERMLVDRQAGLIRLLAPPFDREPRDPGYIKGYVPGIRENGGQYTHAAVWTMQAMAALGWRDRAAATLEMLAPSSHTASAARLGVYQTEPYVVAADVYGAPPHVGRGGWTWYTGSSAWMLRVALGSVLGIAVENGDTLVVSPCIPDDWPGYTARLDLFDDSVRLEVEVRNPDGVAATVVGVEFDGRSLPPQGGRARVPLERGRERRRLVVTLGERVAD